MSDLKTHAALSKKILAATVPYRGGWRALIGVVAGRDHNIEAYDVCRYGVALNEQAARGIFPHLADEEYTG